MSANKVQMIQVSNQELYVFGKLISRHTDFPWLFSITDVYKACEIPLKKEGKRIGKDSGIHATLIMTNPEVKQLLYTLTFKLKHT